MRRICRWVSYFPLRGNDKNPILNLKVCCFTGVILGLAECHRRLQSWGNNLDVSPEDRSYWALRKPWRHLIPHLSSSLQTISWARLERILHLSLARTDRHAYAQIWWMRWERTQALLFQQSMTPFTPPTLPGSTVWLLDRSVVLSLTSFQNKCRQMSGALGSIFILVRDGINLEAGGKVDTSVSESWCYCNIYILKNVGHRAMCFTAIWL